MFRPNRTAQRQLERQAAFQKTRQQAAQEIARNASALAPDGGPHKGVRETYQAASDGDQIRAETTDAFGHLVELGSKNNPPYAPLRRAARAVGLRLDEI